MIAPVLIVVVIGGAAVVQWRTSGGPGRSSISAGDRLVVVGYEGKVYGNVTPAAEVTLEVLRDGVVRATARGAADASGAYDLAAGYDSGHTPGIHNGDVVRVTDGSTHERYEQPVDVVGWLDENAGVLDGTARPNASLRITAYPTGSHNDNRGTTTAVADAEGRFRVDLSAALSEHPAPAPDRPLWRGYHVDIEARDPGVAAQMVVREIQTVNTTLVSTRNHVGGGYFLPGDTVEFELSREGTVIERLSAVADDDGIPQAILSTDVVAGDVLITHFHDAGGRTQSQSLEPFSLTGVVDLAAGTITGEAAPLAPVVAHYHTPNGQESASVIADESGRYSLQFDRLIGDRSVEVFRIADAGYTGVGAQQIEFRTPAVRLDDPSGKVTGFAAPIAEAFTMTLQRNGADVVSVAGDTAKEGSFTALFPVEVRPGDTIAVRTETQTLAPFAVGADELTVRWGGSDQGNIEGTGSAGRKVTVTIGSAPACTFAADIGADNMWRAALPCAVHPTDLVYMQEQETDGPAAGSSRTHGQTLTVPVVLLTQPPEVAVVPRTFALTAAVVDSDDPAAAARIDFLVGALVVPAQGTSATVTLAPGRYDVRAVAYDAGGRVDAAGAPIFAMSRARQIVVR